MTKRPEKSVNGGILREWGVKPVHTQKEETPIRPPIPPERAFIVLEVTCSLCGAVVAGSTCSSCGSAQ